MIALKNIGSARAEISRTIIAGSVAFAAMVVPTGALGSERASQHTVTQTGYVLPLPPIPYLESMRWMNWDLSGPRLKVDTLLLPDSTEPGKLRLPSGSEQELTNVS
jgi:hypothetical protein